MTALTEIILALPRWIEAHVSKPGCSLATAEDRMRFVIRLAELNVAHGTGGPFGAAVFDMRTTQLLSVGVNAVVEAPRDDMNERCRTVSIVERMPEVCHLRPGRR